MFYRYKGKRLRVRVENLLSFGKSMLYLIFFFFFLSLCLYILFCCLGLLATVPSNPNGNGNGGLMGYSPGESISGCGSTGGQSNSFDTWSYWNWSTRASFIMPLALYILKNNCFQCTSHFQIYEDIFRYFFKSQMCKNCLTCFSPRKLLKVDQTVWFQKHLNMIFF